MILCYTIIGEADADCREKVLANLQKHPHIVRAEIYSGPHKLVIEMSEYISVEELQQIIDPERACFIRKDDTNQKEN